MFSIEVVINIPTTKADFHLGYDLSESGEYKKAIDAYEKANKLNPEDANVRYNLELALDDISLGHYGLTSKEQGKIKEAKEYYLKAAAAAHANGDSDRVIRYEKWARRL